MLPRIKNVEIGKIHINDSIVTNDFFIHPNGVENLDSSRLSKADYERMLLHDPEVLIFGTGFMGRARIPEKIIDEAGKSASLHVLSTPDALKKFQEIARKGKKVIAYIHVGE